MKTRGPGRGGGGGGAVAGKSRRHGLRKQADMQPRPLSTLQYNLLTRPSFGSLVGG